MYLTENDIIAFDALTLMSEEVINALYNIDDGLEQERLKAMMIVQAKKESCHVELKKIFKTYDTAQKKLREAQGEHIGPVRTNIPLMKDGSGQVMSSIRNFKNILSYDPVFSDMTFNLMSHLPEIRGKRWKESDDSRTRMFIEEKYGIHNPAKLTDAINVLFDEKGYHPLKDIIESVEWDGHTRMEDMLIKYMMAEDCNYSREVSRLIFAGGIHRIYNLGCKFDYVPVLIGTHQGEGKSSFIRWLSMNEDYYRTISSIEGKEGIEVIEGAWICEIDELLALTKTKEVEAVKSYITRQTDVYRKVYERRINTQPRQCIFIGSTNKSQFLTDKSGNRRFLPIKVTQQGRVLYSWEKECKADILQCWAEALYKYKNNDLPCYMSISIESVVQERQAAAVEDDYRVGMIEEYITKHKLNRVCIKELWEYALRRDPERYSRRESNEIVMILESVMGLEKCGRFRSEEYGQQFYWDCRKIVINSQ